MEDLLSSSADLSQLNIPIDRILKLNPIPIKKKPVAERMLILFVLVNKPLV
ncbi:hypothetical protein CASFOL_015797 [Castilleja foliolosa]|uniref:Uncharacterized protein n=1 Tax=Castilleja foliolosa TaxID=1961234 RepID=A0ABD3DG81_9LAMI